MGRLLEIGRPEFAFVNNLFQKALDYLVKRLIKMVYYIILRSFGKDEKVV
jgi:hypothetical protein